jgi:hypothetical protein
MVLTTKKLRPCPHVHPILASGQIGCEQCGLVIQGNAALQEVLKANTARANDDRILREH